MNHKKFLITVFTIATLMLIVWFSPSRTSSESPEKSPTVQNSQLPKASEVDVKNTVVQSSIEDANQNCISRAAFANSSLLAEYEQWSLEYTGYGKVTNENYMDEQTLLNQANAGNRQAMFVLGRNYAWQAVNTGFVSPEVRPSEIEALPSQGQPYNSKTMEKARFWLNKAASFGLLGAFGELSQTYFIQWQHIQDSNPVAEQAKETLLLKVSAYNVFQGQLSPQVYYHKSNQYPADLNQKQQQEFDSLLKQIQNEWQYSRQALGFETAINQAIPNAFYEVKNIKFCD